jgi:hypothetical protein
VTAFATGLLTGSLPAWSGDQWLALATDRRKERAIKSAQPLPPELDAALLVVAAQVLLAAGQENSAAQLAGWAVEEMPGHKALCAWEASVAAGQPPVKINLEALILGTEPEADVTPEPEAGRSIDAEPEAVPPLDGDQLQADLNETNDDDASAASPSSTASLRPSPAPQQGQATSGW